MLLNKELKDSLTHEKLIFQHANDSQLTKTALQVLVLKQTLKFAFNSVMAMRMTASKCLSVS